MYCSYDIQVKLYTPRAIYVHEYQIFFMLLLFFSYGTSVVMYDNVL